MLATGRDRRDAMGERCLVRRVVTRSELDERDQVRPVQCAVVTDGALSPAKVATEILSQAQQRPPAVEGEVLDLDGLEAEVVPDLRVGGLEEALLEGEHGTDQQRERQIRTI